MTRAMGGRARTAGLGLGALATAAAVIFACSGGNDSGEPPAPADAQADALDGSVREDVSRPPVDGSPDVALDADADAADAGPCSATGPLPSATKLTAGTIEIYGVTNEGHVVYAIKGATSSSLEAISLAGGSALPIAVLSSRFDVVVKNDVVGIWTDVVPQNGLGTFNVWTRLGGLKQDVATGSGPSFVGFAVSADSKRIAFRFDVDKVAVTSSTTPAVTEGAATAIVDTIWFDQTCVPHADFVNDVFFMGYCPIADATPKARVVMVAPTANPSVQVLANTALAAQALRGLRPIWRSDLAGTTLFAAGYQSNQARVIKVATPDADATSVADDLLTTTSLESHGFLTDDGSALLYVSTAHELKRAATATSSASVLVQPDVLGLLRVSPDKKYVLFNSQPALASSGSWYDHDIKLADTSTPGQTPIDLVTTQTGGLGGFTATGSHVFWFDGLAISPAPVGTLHARGTAPNAASRQLASNVAYNPAPRGLATGTKIVFFENVVPVAGGAEGDVKVVDVACPNPPRLVTAAADVSTMLAVSGTKAVYAKGGATPGLFVIDLQ